MKKMEIQVVSDLHLDFVKSPIKNWRKIVEPVAPYLCILGDTIELSNITVFKHFLEKLAPHWKHIILINGNHEFYGYKSRHNKEKLLKKQARVLKEFDNITLLENSYIDLTEEEKTVRVAGSVLWSYVPKHAVEDVEWYMNDYRSIYTGKRTIDTKITNSWHEEAVRFLTKTIEESPHPVAILTHHAPLMYGTSDPKYIESKDRDRRLTQHGFATNLEGLMKDKVIFWAFGHTHWCCDFFYRGTRIYSNARGYDNETKYQNSQVIKLI